MTFSKVLSNPIAMEDRTSSNLNNSVVNHQPAQTPPPPAKKNNNRNPIHTYERTNKVSVSQQKNSRIYLIAAE